MKKNSGQILLITVMLIATAITVVMTLAFKSTTETQTTKLEEESERALIAAESALEKALKSGVGTYTTLGLSNLTGIDLDNSSVTLDQPDVDYFVSPQVIKDEAYTFYLADYPGFGNSWTGSLTIYFSSEGGTNCSSRNVPAIEATLIYDGAVPNTNATKRWVIEPCSSGTTISGADISATTFNDKFQEVTFQYKANALDLTAYAGAKILILRPFFGSTKIGIEGSANLKTQGNYYISEAKSYSGVTKKIKLFQAYPQIPSEFFVTSF